MKKNHQTFGRAERFPTQISYTSCFTTALPLPSVSLGPTFPKGQRSFNKKNSQTPGPGNYQLSTEPTTQKRFHQERYKINKTFLDYMRSRPKTQHIDYPGPGAYDINSTIRKRGISFTKAEGGFSLVLSSGPGPGQYTLSRPPTRLSRNSYKVT